MIRLHVLFCRRRAHPTLQVTGPPSSATVHYGWRGIGPCTMDGLEPGAQWRGPASVRHRFRAEPGSLCRSQVVGADDVLGHRGGRCSPGLFPVRDTACCASDTARGLPHAPAVSAARGGEHLREVQADRVPLAGRLCTMGRLGRGVHHGLEATAGCAGPPRRSCTGYRGRCWAALRTGAAPSPYPAVGAESEYVPACR